LTKYLDEAYNLEGLSLRYQEAQDILSVEGDKKIRGVVKETMKNKRNGNTYISFCNIPVLRLCSPLMKQ